jgi:hypothetical protein
MSGPLLRRPLLGRILAWAGFVAALAVTSSAFAQPIPGGPDDSPAATATGSLGRGFTLRAKDDSALVNLRLRTQFQGFFETKPVDAKTQERPRPDMGFLIRRMRLVFQGHVFDRDIRYYVQFGFSSRDQEPDLLVPVRDAQLLWTGLRDLNLRVGQMKVPFNRERVISSSALSMVDRSNVNAELNLDRDVGIMVQSRDLFGLGGVLGYSLGAFGGDGRNRFTSNTGLLYVARLEVLPFGSFDDYSQGDFSRSWKPRLALGFATAYSDATPRSRSTTGDTFKNGTVDYRHGAADLILKIGGITLSSELSFRQSAQTNLTRVDSGGITELPRNAWGFMTQVGMMLTNHWETSVRYGEVRPKDATNPTLRRDREVGAAVSYYFHKHDLKVQMDYFRLVRGADRWGDDALGTDRVRLQAQFFF